MNYEILSYVSSALALIASGGWFVFYKANKRIKEGEAIQSEADGWKKQQEVYQTTIEDQRKFYDNLKSDFTAVMEENTRLRKENGELRETVTKLQDTVLEMKNELSRLGRKVASMDKEKKAKRTKKV